MEERGKPRPETDSPELLAPRRGVPLAGIALAAAVIGVVAVCLWRLQFATDAIVGQDGYFHIKFAYLMSHGHGLIRKLPWLHFTIHRDFYRDHHFLQHVLYVPFTFGDLRIGAKVAAWFFATAGMSTFYIVAARRGKVVAAVLTMIMLGASACFLERMMFPRVPSMAMIALLLVFHALIARRNRYLAGVMFSFVWLYDGFILGVFAIVGFLVADLLVDRKWNWRTVTWGLGGTAAGMIVNPYFPHNIKSYIFNLQRAATSAQVTVDTGWEWMPFDLGFLLQSAKSIWIALGVAILLLALAGKPKRDTVGLLLFALFATALVMKARRYMDTWPPVVLLLLAWAWADFWERRSTLAPRWGRRSQWAATACLAGLIAFTPSVYHEQWRQIRRARDFAYFRGAAEYLRTHAKPNTVIFNTDWDDFPPLFFFNSDHYYVVGLDQLYMDRYDPDLFAQWKAICDGKTPMPSHAIRKQFGAEYVVVDVRGRQRRKFMKQVALDRAVRCEYRDIYCAVYRILPSP